MSMLLQRSCSQGWDYTESQVRQARLLLDDFGLKAMGMQSLLYGLPELNVFANP